MTEEMAGMRGFTDQDTHRGSGFGGVCIVEQCGTEPRYFAGVGDGLGQKAYSFTLNPTWLMPHP